MFSLAYSTRGVTVPLDSTGARSNDHVRELWTRTDTAHDGQFPRADLPSNGAAPYSPAPARQG
ncbi:hypothetical protein ACFYSF_33795 [Streptomyces canus]|uniref:hypothetical protein n=1 Tax=Streptomyces canus TaxID=58343 RepID=UPI0036B0CC52